MSATKQKKTGKAAFSAILLVLALGALIYAAPRLQSWIAEWKSAHPDEQAEGGQVSDSAPSQIQTQPQPQCPEGLRSWLPLVVAQMPTDSELTYRLVHMRLSQDKSKLLLDIEKIGQQTSERFDLVLNRDEFGRYISDHQALPMKLYPPDEVQEKAPAAESE